jgi:hypothetical protein
MLQMKKERMPEAIKPFLNFHTNSLSFNLEYLSYSKT